MKVQPDAEQQLADGFAAIAKQYALPGSFPAEVLVAAESVANRDDSTRSRPAVIDRTDIPYVTMDPASSTDLDQAFYLAKDAEEIVLYYALADVGAFVPTGGAVEREAWRRGVTIYGLAEKVPLYPPVLSQQAASLLPDGPRPAIQVVVAIRPNGELRLRSIDRVICSSRAKLAYASVDLDSIPWLEAFAQRMWLNEAERGALRFEFPQQEVIADADSPGGVRLVLRVPAYSERVNSALSLSVNMVIADLLKRARVGLFRVMDEPERRAIERLRREAHALKIAWSPDESMRDLLRKLDTNSLLHQRFLMTVRRAGGRASYATYSDEKLPWHAAVGAPYVHATAPMRRLADRYVLDLAYLIANDQPIPDGLLTSLQSLPEVMAAGDGRARGVDRAVIDLVEAVSLHQRIGEILDAEVVDADAGIVQTFDSAIRSRAAKLPRYENGDIVRVRIDQADPMKRTVVLTAVQSDQQ